MNVFLVGLVFSEFFGSFFFYFLWYFPNFFCDSFFFVLGPFDRAIGLTTPTWVKRALGPTLHPCLVAQLGLGPPKLEPIWPGFGLGRPGQILSNHYSRLVHYKGLGALIGFLILWVYPKTNLGWSNVYGLAFMHVNCPV